MKETRSLPRATFHVPEHEDHHGGKTTQPHSRRPAKNKGNINREREVVQAATPLEPSSAGLSSLGVNIGFKQMSAAKTKADILRIVNFKLGEDERPRKMAPSTD